MENTHLCIWQSVSNIQDSSPEIVTHHHYKEKNLRGLKKLRIQHITQLCLILLHLQRVCLGFIDLATSSY